MSLGQINSLSRTMNVYCIILVLVHFVTDYASDDARQILQMCHTQVSRTKDLKR